MEQLELGLVVHICNSCYLEGRVLNWEILNSRAMLKPPQKKEKKEEKIFDLLLTLVCMYVYIYNLISNKKVHYIV